MLGIGTHHIIIISKAEIHKPKVYTVDMQVLSEPNYVQEALSIPEWRQAMATEYSAL